MATTDQSTPKTPKIPKRSFVNRNLVAIVMIPSIIFIHFGWSVMQNNRKLVSESEQIEQPIITLAKYSWNRLMGNIPDEKKSTAPAAK